MKAPVAVGVSLAVLVVSALAFSVLLLPLAAAAQGVFCIDFADESLQAEFVAYGCGTEDDANAVGFGYWFTLLHAEFLGVSEGEFGVLHWMANYAGNDGEGLLHIKMCAAYLGKIWFAGWLTVVLVFLLPKVDDWKQYKPARARMRAITAISVSVALLIVSGLALSILLLPLAAAAQGVFCIDVADESLPLGDRLHFVEYGCGTEDDANAVGFDESSNRPGFGYWFTLLHAEFLGVSEGEFGVLHWMANYAGNDGEGLLHIKMCAAYLGKIWFAGWLVVVLFVIVPRTSAPAAVIAAITTNSSPPNEIIGAEQTESR